MDLNLTLKPAQLEFIAKPGASITQAYNVTNNSANSIVLSTSVDPWLPTGPNGNVVYQGVPQNPNFEFSLNNADLKLGQSFILQPKESRQLVLKIKSFPQTPATDAYFTFFVSQDLSNSLRSSDNSAVSGRLGSHILISTSDSEDIPLKSQIVNLRASPPLVDVFFPRVTLQGQIANLGEYFFKTDGKITITKNDQPIKELNIFPQNVLASSSRNILCNSGNEPVACTLNPPYWPGLYTVTLNNTSTSFFVFPFSILFLTLAIATIFFLFRRRSPPSQTR